VERKKILRRAALIGVAVFLVAVAAAGAMALKVRRMDVRHRALADEQMAQLAKEYQGYLDETAKAIKGLPVDPKVIGEIQTRHYQQQPALLLYVWASSNAGEFQFGVPSDAFARLNTAYDQNREVIAKDNHFANRDSFLRTLLHHSRRIENAEVGGSDDSDDGRSPARRHEPSWWRFYDEGEDWGFSRDRVIFLSSPIQDAGGATVGNLNLKLVNLKGPADESKEVPERIMIGGVIGMVASLVWLWFLLPSWVYIDAQQRHVPRPLLWSLLTLIGSVFALLVYLVSRPTDSGEFRCPQCSKMLNGSKAGCPYCGADLSAVFCPQCQYPLKPGWSFCPSCRSALTKTSGGLDAPAEPPVEPTNT
jgi:RNA polymerase subunit RPABC4/transcription elongation factor Spt4